KYALKENNNPSAPTSPPPGNNIPLSSSYSVPIHSTNENINSTTTEPKPTPKQIDLNPPESNSPDEVNQFDNNSADNSPETPPNSKEKSTLTKPFSSNSPKPKLNGGFIVATVVIVSFSVIGLGYLI
ncbi:13911_t:CDS:1, partial [Funneliformis geosporum]